MPLIQRFQVVLHTGIIITSLFLFCFAIRPLAQGYWFQIEGPMFTLSILSLLTLFGLKTRALQHPAAMIPLALALLSLLLLPFATVPLISLLGTPELGEGILWFISAGILSALTNQISEHDLARKIVGLSALLSLSINASLMLIHWDKPYYFDDYLAFSTLFTVLILANTWKIHTQKIFYLPLLAYTTLILYLVDNKTALALWCIGLPAHYVFFIFLKKQSFTQQKKIATLFVFLGPLLIWLILGFLNHSSLIELGGKRETLWSRYQLSSVVVQTLQKNPSEWLTGRGWGAYPDASIASLDIERSPLHQNDEKSHYTLWEFLFDRNPFHSHNELSEALLSSGILGMILMALWYGLPPLLSTQATLPLYTLIGGITLCLGSLWFQVPTTLPFMAIALGSIPSHFHFRWISDFFIKWVIKPVLFFTLIIGAYHQLQNLRHNEPLKRTPLYESMTASACGDHLVNFNAGGYLLIQYFRDLEKAFKTLNKEELALHQMPERLRWIHCVVDRQWEHNPSLRLMSSDLITYSDWAFFEDDPERIPPWIFQGWENKIHRWLSVAPNRTDLIAPYLMWQLTNGQEAQIQPLLNRILKDNPNDPVGLWFSGIALLNDEKTATLGQRRMQRALLLGIDRIIPVEKSLIEQLQTL